MQEDTFQDEGKAGVESLGGHAELSFDNLLAHGRQLWVTKRVLFN